MSTDTFRNVSTKLAAVQVNDMSIDCDWNEWRSYLLSSHRRRTKTEVHFQNSWKHSPHVSARKHSKVASVGTNDTFLNVLCAVEMGFVGRFGQAPTVVESGFCLWACKNHCLWSLLWWFLTWSKKFSLCESQERLLYVAFSYLGLRLLRHGFW